MNYETQTLKKVAEEIGGKVFNFTVYGQKCEPYQVTLNQTTYVQVPVGPVKRNRTICNWVQEQGPGQKVKMMIWESVSRKMCYDIPVPVCNQSPCAQQGRCNQGTSPCSSTNKVPATVCPFSGKLHSPTMHNFSRVFFTITMGRVLKILGVPDPLVTRE